MIAWVSLLVGAAVAAAPAPPEFPKSSLTPADARRSLIGQWEGKLEYRDYQADRWFGLPVKVEIRDGGDGVTQIRTADYDDGPKTGTVRITTVSLLADDGLEESGASFRKGRAVELETTRLSLEPGSKSVDQWTMIETSEGKDDDRPATLRLTTVRTGNKVVTVKEVDFSDDKKAEWLVRNRTTLEKR